MNNQPSRFEQFILDFQNNPAYFKEKLSGNGSFEFSDSISLLQEFSNKVNYNIFIYLFGKQLGEHLVEKFAIECDRNLLKFLSSIDSEYKFFILYEIKTNSVLYFYS